MFHQDSALVSVVKRILIPADNPCGSAENSHLPAGGENDFLHCKLN